MFQSQKDSVKERLNRLSLGNMFQVKPPVVTKVEETEVKKVEKPVKSNQVKSSGKGRSHTPAKK